MKSDSYQKWAITKNRESYVDVIDRLRGDANKTADQLHAALGICGEAGELMDAIKKRVLYGKDLDVENVKEELGDLCWYMNLMLHAIGSTWEEVMKMNHDKLEKRFPSGFTEKAAQVRADKEPGQ